MLAWRSAKPIRIGFHSQVKRMVVSYVGENPVFENLYLNGDVEVVLTPQVSKPIMSAVHT